MGFDQYNLPRSLVYNQVYVCVINNLAKFMYCHCFCSLDIQHSFMLSFCVTDIDECSGSTFDCVALSNCSNTNGSYRCDCIDGYEWDSTNTTCQGRLPVNMFRSTQFIIWPNQCYVVALVVLAFSIRLC